MNAKDQQHSEWQDVVERAYLAGDLAAQNAIPTPMVVGTPKDLVGSLFGGDGGGFDPNEPTYYVSEGACGFAWVNVKGDRKFLNWLKGSVTSKYPATAALGDAAREPRSDSYYGGVSLWVGGYGQSVARKEAFANAFAEALRSSLPEVKAYGMSRLD
jgi:hypothetical protein